MVSYARVVSHEDLRGAILWFVPADRYSRSFSIDVRRGEECAFTVVIGWIVAAFILSTIDYCGRESEDMQI